LSTPSIPDRDQVTTHPVCIRSQETPTVKLYLECICWCLKFIYLLQAGRKCKFDQTVEVCLRLGTDPKRGDQQVRGSVVLPNGTGKSVRLCVFAEGEAAEMARKAGAPPPLLSLEITKLTSWLEPLNPKPYQPPVYASLQS
jgi:hypothetical protein